MSLSLIVARASNGVIGKDNKLLWHLSDDMKWFKSCTMGHPVVMGRKTFESLPKLLPGRKHYVLTGDVTYQAPAEVNIFHTPEELLAALPEGENFIIGGGAMYRLFFPYVDKMYITEIERVYEGDTVFPDFDETEWTLISSKEGEGEILHRFVVYEKK